MVNEDYGPRWYFYKSLDYMTLIVAHKSKQGSILLRVALMLQNKLQWKCKCLTCECIKVNFKVNEVAYCDISPNRENEPLCPALEVKEKGSQTPEK